jgi:hypothetical protein
MMAAPRFGRNQAWTANRANSIPEYARRAMPFVDTTQVGIHSNIGTSRRPRKSITPPLFPWDKIVFGHTLSGTDATIYNGELHWGDQAFKTVANTTVDVSAAAAWVGCEFDGTTLSIPAASSTTTTFQSDATTYRTWLYKFEVEPGAGPVLALWNPVGIIDLDASWGG